MASPLQLSECIIQIPGAKKYRLKGTRRRPDNIGQIPIENLLSPVLPAGGRGGRSGACARRPRAREAVRTLPSGAQGSCAPWGSVRKLVGAPRRARQARRARHEEDV